MRRRSCATRSNASAERSRILRDGALQPGFDRQEPGLGDGCRERLARIGVVGGRRRGLRLRRGTPVAQAAPDVELERRVQPDAVQSAAAARLAAAHRVDAYRGQQRRARHLHVAGSLLDPRRRHLQVGVVQLRLVDQRRQRGIVEGRQPAVGHRRVRAPPLPSTPRGTLVCGIACCCSSAAVGGGLSAQPASAAATVAARMPARMRRTSRISAASARGSR